MPPRTRSSKPLKSSKENIGSINKNKIKSVGKATKHRKALADRTNSASDDNSSPKITKKFIKENVKNQIKNNNLEIKERPRRDRKLPNKYQQSEVLLNLSNNKNNDAENNNSPDKNNSSISPIKTPQDIDSSLIGNRPRRICHLPSRYDDHSITPNKFVPVGCHASTPIVQNKNVTLKNKSKSIAMDNKTTSLKGTKKQTLSNKKNLQNEPKVILNKLSPKKRTVDTSATKAKTETNNKAKKRLLTERNVSKNSEETNNKNTGKKLLTANFSFRVLEDKSKPSKRKSSHLDVYEFTYDPNEEPPNQKKKRKKVVKKKPPKPKTVYLKTNYDKNISKALATLKNAVTKKPVEPEVNKNLNIKDVVNNNDQIVSNVQPIVSKQSEKQIMSSVPKEPVVTFAAKNQTHIQQDNNMSTRVEDIVADFEPIMDDIDYSPVNSPNRAASPVPNTERYTNIEPSIHNNDPLNLRENLSFFGEPPVASSSMNISTRQPYASPWRVQFEQLPIKWHVNSYVKANMTPAVESSFFNFDDSKNKKKHVYTSLVPESNVELPQIVDNNQQNLKQTSIISFIKGVIERSATKKKRAKSITPNKKSTVDNVSKTIDTNNAITTKKTTGEEPSNYWTPEKSTDDNVLINESNENKNQQNEVDKENHKDGTFFGFDESEDRENISPVKVNVDNKKVRALRPRARAVLQEINTLSKPTRAKIPLAAKTQIAPSSEVINKVYENMKSATDAPVFPDKYADNPCIETTNVGQSGEQYLNEDQESVHLFEDIEVVHHYKQPRKSYGKSKKVAFQQTATVDSVYQGNARDSGSSDEDDLADLTFTMPNMEQKNKPKKKGKSKKKQQSKKEKAEMEAWAAQFNSMCEDIDEFPLVVE